MDFKKAGFRYRAMDTFREVVAFEPKNAYALANLLKIHEEEQDWEKALSLQEELAKVTGTEDSVRRAFLYDQIGQAAAASGDEQKAVRAFEESMRVGPRVPAAYLHYGDLLESEGRADEAEAQWSRLARENPPHAHLTFERLERVRRKLERSEKMEKLFEEVLRADESDWRARLALARLRRSQGRGEEAFQLLLEAVRRNPHALAVHIDVWRFLGASSSNGDAARSWRVTSTRSPAPRSSSTPTSASSATTGRTESCGAALTARSGTLSSRSGSRPSSPDVQRARSFAARSSTCFKVSSMVPEVSTRKSAKGSFSSIGI